MTISTVRPACILCMFGIGIFSSSQFRSTETITAVWTKFTCAVQPMSPGAQWIKQWPALATVWVKIPKEVKFFWSVNRVSLHTTFHFYPSAGLIILKYMYCEKSCKPQVKYPSIFFSLCKLHLERTAWAVLAFPGILCIKLQPSFMMLFTYKLLHRWCRHWRQCW